MTLSIHRTERAAVYPYLTGDISINKLTPALPGASHRSHRCEGSCLWGGPCHLYFPDNSWLRDLTLLTSVWTECQRLAYDVRCRKGSMDATSRTRPRCPEEAGVPYGRWTKEVMGCALVHSQSTGTLAPAVLNQGEQIRGYQHIDFRVAWFPFLIVYRCLLPNS